MQISANKGSYYDGFIQKKELELQKSRMQSKSDDLTRSQEKLSSGSSINRAGDDPAGLAVSEKMRAYITIYDQLDENVSDGQNLVRTAEGALSGVSDMLGRVNELSMQASNGIYSDLERSFMQKELDSIVSEISRVSQSTTFNGINVFSGDSIDLQVGADSTGTVAVPTDGLAAVLDSVKNYDITTASSAMQTVSASRDAINYISSARGDLGAIDNALDHTSDSLSYMQENLQRAESEIRDTDYAKEASEASLASLRLQTANLLMSEMQANIGNLVNLMG